MRILATISIALLVSGPAFAEALPIDPGEWEMKTEIKTTEMPGMPPEAAQMMKGAPHVVKFCITPEDAAKGPEALAKNSNGDCKFLKYSVHGSSLDAVMECNHPDQGKMMITTSGTFTRTSYSTDSHMEMSGGSGMKMTSSSTSKRIGPCPN